MLGVFNLCDVLQLIIDRSTKARFLSRILSATLIKESFMLFLTLVISVCHQKRDSQTGLARYTLVRTEFALYILQEPFLFQRIMVVHVSQRELEI